MNTFLYIFSDNIWLPLLELFILILFFRAIIYEIRARRPRGLKAEVERGEKSLGILFAFWALTIIIIEIIISSELINKYKVIVGLMNLAILIYLNFFSGYFRNKIIGWAGRFKKLTEH